MLITLMWEALCTYNSCHKVRSLTRTFTDTSYGLWCGQCEVRDGNGSKKNHGCFTTTMLRPAMPWASGDFLPKIAFVRGSNFDALQTRLPVIFLCSLSSRKSWKKDFFWHRSIKMAVTKELRVIPEKSFQECMVACQWRMAKCVRSQGNYFEGGIL